MQLVLLMIAMYFQVTNVSRVLTKRGQNSNLKVPFWPKSKMSKIFCIRNLKASETFRALLCIENISQDLFCCSLVKISLFPPYFLLVTPIEVQFRALFLNFIKKGHRGTPLFLYSQARTIITLSILSSSWVLTLAQRRKDSDVNSDTVCDPLWSLLLEK